MNDRTAKWPPDLPERLPERHNRLTRSDQPRLTIADSLSLRVVTPIFGGGPVPRKVDQVEVIRAASIRGQLRFWWRALHAQNYADSKALYNAETTLWGGPTTPDSGGRSSVEIRVDLTQRPSRADIDTSKPPAPSEHALFPAREQASHERNNKPGKPPGERYKPGVEFKLTISAPRDRADEVRDALRAWLLFGGYGGRTRRGLGSVTVTAAREGWLPKAATQAAIQELFGRDIFAAPSVETSVPGLAGAELFAGSPASSADASWTTAITWLRDFRQGKKEPYPARQLGSDHTRPGRSNWPEADKVRHLSTRPRNMEWAHPPRHNENPAWPRAVLGLPIIGQFQGRTRNSDGEEKWEDLDPPKTEPKNFELGWRDAHGDHRDRLASPLIVKTLPLADGKFAPIALWLSRTNPPGKVVLKDLKDLRVRNIEETAADFATLVAEGDTPRFSLLAKHKTLRDIFFAWLKAQPKSPAPTRSSSLNKHGSSTQRGGRR